MRGEILLYTRQTPCTLDKVNAVLQESRQERTMRQKNYTYMRSIFPRNK